MIRRLASAVARKTLDRLGYLFLKREFVRFGYSLFVDLRRVGDNWGWSIDTVFDVGANVGQFARETLRELPQAKVHSFEPHPTTYARLTENLGDPRLTPHQLALGDKEGEATLYVYGDDGSSTLINSLVPDAKFPTKFGYKPTEVKVRCATIDNVCQENGVTRIDLLKVDTEGFDLTVLQGAERMFREGRVRFVYVEFSELLPSGGETSGALTPIAEYLGRFGFQYLVTYTDFVLHRGEVSVCANALFVAPPPTAQ
jgi:FkbM family methyltransferase